MQQVKKDKAAGDVRTNPGMSFPLKSFAEAPHATNFLEPHAEDAKKKPYFALLRSRMELVDYEAAHGLQTLRALGDAASRVPLGNPKAGSPTTIVGALSARHRSHTTMVSWGVQAVSKPDLSQLSSFFRATFLGYLMLFSPSKKRGGLPGGRNFL